jgi:glc operon protein GlcG
MTTKSTLIVATFLAALSTMTSAVQAQVATRKTLTLEGADKAIAAATAVARTRKVGGVVAVVDDGGNLMALQRLDGTFAAGAMISIGKARTAALFKKPTRFFEEVIGKGRTSMVALNDFTPLQGGVPIVVEGQIVGAIGVSGASSAKEDEELAIAGAAALANVTAAAPVRFIDKEKVAAAFVKGMPLIETGDYKVHASHRDGAGKAELHTQDTDILYVLDGTATLVTGGTIVDPKTIETDEVRGASIRGGESRALAPGDVVIVPKGVPHWFAQVPGKLDYYAVKVH